MNKIDIELKKKFPEFELDLSFTAEEGQLISIIGPSGCGKSTTLQLITGLLPLDEGHIIIDEIDLASIPTNKREIAMVFQNYSLYPHMNVQKNIEYPLKIKKVNKIERNEKSLELLELVGLSGFEKRKVESLSGGECQRVALARALASKPRLLLLDEPLSALDAKLRGHLRDEIRRIHDETGLTMIYVTHDQEEALSISDKIIVVNKGKIEMIGDGEEIYNNPSSLFTATFMGEGNLVPSSVINPLLNINESDDSSYFFRPEEALIIENSNLPIPELLPHILIEDVNITKVEFRGNRYMVSAQKENVKFLISSSYKPRYKSVILSVRKASLKKF